MAKIQTSTDESIFQIKKWLGVNDGTDGDTQIKMGEAAESRNWRVTKDGSLQVRPGTETVWDFDGEPIRGMWFGRVGDTEYFVCAAGGKLWKLEDGEEPDMTEIGDIDDAPTEFFGYSEKLYMLNGTEYKVWDGTTLDDVEGYRPLVATAATPGGSGTLLEQVNKLTGARRIQFSPDGSATVFHLPDAPVDSVDYVKDMVTGQLITTGWTASVTDGTVTFETAPAQGVNTYEIGYTAIADDRAKICAMRFFESFNGANDNRVFLYGDGTNQCVYSGLDENGRPTAEYFPDLNVMSVGDANTPITSMIRHFSRLLVFKTNSTYSVQFGDVTTAAGLVTPAFYATPVNRILGNVAPGQVRLVLNNPRSLHESAVYEWKSSNGYLTSDERQAKRISQRINTALSNMDMASVCVFDDEYRQEYYIVDTNGKAIVHNYAVDAWDIYTDFPAIVMLRVGKKLFMGTADGKIKHISRNYRSDDGEPIDAFWRSGSMDFTKDWKRKYTSTIWIAMLPESGARLVVTARSNRKSDYDDKVVAYGLSSFIRMNFAHFSFGTNRQPQVNRVKLKVKKYTYYQLIFESNSASSTATIVGVDISVRYSGDVK